MDKMTMHGLAYSRPGGAAQCRTISILVEQAFCLLSLCSDSRKKKAGRGLRLTGMPADLGKLDHANFKTGLETVLISISGCRSAWVSVKKAPDCGSVDRSKKTDSTALLLPHFQKSDWYPIIT
jgi:hypothetical protein